MRDNDLVEDGGSSVPDRFRIDWGYSENRYEQPEWKKEEQRVVRNAPVSCSRNQKMRLSLELTINKRGNAPSSLSGRIVGHPGTSANRWFKFTSDTLKLTEGTHSVSVVAKEPLSSWPTELGETIQWTFATQKGTLDLGQSGPHTVFVTFGVPTEDENTPSAYRATFARMREATRRVGKIGHCPSVTLIEQLFKPFERYILGPGDLLEPEQQEVQRDGHLQTYMTEVDWPRFLGSKRAGSLEKKLGKLEQRVSELKGNIEKRQIRIRNKKEQMETVGTPDEDGNTEPEDRICEVRRCAERIVQESIEFIEQSEREVAARESEKARTARQISREQIGAWPLAVLEKYGGECQAIVRFVLAVLRQIGFQERSRWDSVEIRYVSAEPRGTDYQPIIHSDPVGCSSEYTLVNRPVQTRFYSGEEVVRERIRANNFEAFLRYRYKKNGQFYQAWYGGGIGLIGQPQAEPITSAFYRQLLSAPFAGLAEYRDTEAGVEFTNYWPFR